MKVTNRFKGLDLADRVPEELWTEVRNTVQEAMTTKIPKGKKKMQEGSDCLNRLYKYAEERREVKRKGERKRYTQLNAEFQRIGRR